MDLQPTSVLTYGLLAHVILTRRLRLPPLPSHANTRVINIITYQPPPFIEMASLPESYSTWSLPELKLSHHPECSSLVTPIVLVMLSRPSAKNAFTEVMTNSLVTAFDTLSKDPRVKCVILTSCDPHNKNFCVGMDLNMRSESKEGRQTHRDGSGKVALSIYNCSKPVIAALNGNAIGVGITMTLAANIRVVSEAARVGFVFARRGICMEGTSSFLLPRLIGASRACHLITTGGVYPAGHKLFDGLFSEVVAPEKVIPTAISIAEDVARNTSEVCTRVMKDLVFRGPDTPEEAHLLESKLLYDLFRGRDAAEGMRSFLEKRAPDFQGNITEGQDRPIAWPWWEAKDVTSKI